MAPPNKCIWISSSNELSLRPITETYTPTGSQVLVEVKYSGINPADIKHGLYLGLNDYPSGYEFSGVVLEAGPQAKFVEGDHVFGHNSVGKKKPIYHGSHQNVMIGEDFVFKVPPNMPMQDAANICIMVQTTSDALFNQLELPGGAVLGGQPATGPILIWGGASNVGAAAIQVAKAAGLSPILTTASKHNHERLKALGATACFDYRDADVVAQIKAALKGAGASPLRAIFDTVCSRGPRASTDLCEECGEGEDVVIACTLPQPHKPRRKMVLATRNQSIPNPKPGGGMEMVHGNPTWQGRIDKTLEWCVNHYGEGKGFIVPKVRIVKGGEAGMEAMKFVADGKSSLEKVAIEHPL